MNSLKNMVAQLLLVFGYSIHKSSTLTRSGLLEQSAVLLQLLAASPWTRSLTLEQAFAISDKAKSQLGQDVLAVSQLGINKSGFFVEFGATDGVSLSNTFLLEKEFGWKGILCEPAKQWHKELHLNRTCVVDTRCVYSSTGEQIEFAETSVGELSTISSFVNTDANRKHRKNSNSYHVETVTLEDLLSTHNAPRHIDFLSIDTEGSEYEILKAFNFTKYSFGLICVEHNFTENRERIEKLMLKEGYSKVFSEYSAWDDWYLGPRN